MEKSKMVRIGLRIPYDLNTWLYTEAAKMGMTKNAFILHVFWGLLKEKEEKETCL